MFMFSTKDLKSQAKNNLEGKYFKYFLIMLVTTLLSSIPVFFDHFNMSAQAPDFRHGDSAPFYFDKEIKSLERKNIEFYRKILN